MNVYCSYILCSTVAQLSLNTFGLWLKNFSWQWLALRFWPCLQKNLLTYTYSQQLFAALDALLLHSLWPFCTVLYSVGACRGGPVVSCCIFDLLTSDLHSRGVPSSLEPTTVNVNVNTYTLTLTLLMSVNNDVQEVNISTLVCTTIHHLRPTRHKRTGREPSGNDVVIFVARNGVYDSRTSSCVGRNAQFCCEPYCMMCFVLFCLIIYCLSERLSMTWHCHMLMYLAMVRNGVLPFTDSYFFTADACSFIEFLGTVWCLFICTSSMNKQ